MKYLIKSNISYIHHIFHFCNYVECRFSDTTRKVFKYGVFSGPYFTVFSPNTGKYGPEKNSAFGHFSRSVCMYIDLLLSEYSGL